MTWLPIALVVAIAAVCVALLLGSRHQQQRYTQFTRSLIGTASAPSVAHVTPGGSNSLPPPVKAYLQRVLQANPRMIRLARLEETGTLRTDPHAARWFPFEAKQIVAPLATGFGWNADVRVAPLIHLRVYDSLMDGRGSGRVALLSAFTVGGAAGDPEMNSGALHRYLAEAVWYPTALIPNSNLQWTPLDDRRALATLTSNGVTVSLEFRFNEHDEVIGIFTPGRWGTFRGAYKQVPWEGHFRNYRARDGLLVPSDAEVGWYSGGNWLAVWRGAVVNASYDFAD